eukprot:scaffold923_cov256-Pinguiococcus_pyrenoidosus.AAC.23
MPPSGGLHQLVYEPSKLAGPSAEVGRLRADEVADAFQGHGGKGSGTSQRLVLRRQERHGHQAVAQLAHLVEHQALADHLHLRERLVSARHRRRAVDRHGDQRLGAQLVPGFLSHPGPEASPATPRVRHQQDALRVVTRLQLPPDCILPLVPHGRPDDSSRLKPRGKHVKLRMQLRKEKIGPELRLIRHWFRSLGGSADLHFAFPGRADVAFELLEVVLEALPRPPLAGVRRGGHWANSKGAPRGSPLCYGAPSENSTGACRGGSHRSPPAARCTRGRRSPSERTSRALSAAQNGGKKGEETAELQSRYLRMAWAFKRSLTAPCANWADQNPTIQ